MARVALPDRYAPPVSSPVHVAPATAGFVRALASRGHAVAVVTADEQVSYRDLADRVGDVARRLGGRRPGSGRRLVLLAARNDLDSLVTFLAALSAGHPVLLGPGSNGAAVASLTAAYDPDVVAEGADILERRDGSAHQLHPDLAVLMSTSGSTGSPKLVRLSHDNLQQNAEAIATYLDIRPTDRAATTLPMAYCYGLSVITSHLARGASLLLTGLSVVDTCFWQLFREHRATTFPGVPHTFELLDRVGFADMDVPHLRYVTQAGGRLAPDRVRRFAELGQRSGWDLFVMYGQTEATARMAYLPPHLVHKRPSAIGVPIPGGWLHLRHLSDTGEPVHEDPAVGELVYTGPNVMLGYAETPADLALGRTTDALATGDLARLTPDGLFEVVGRLGRFVKLYGLRIDLQRAEDTFTQLGFTVCCTGDDETLVIAVEGCDDDARMLQRLAATELALPPGAVRVHPVDAIPRLPNGKPDYAAVAGAARPVVPGPRPKPTADAAREAEVLDATALRQLYAELLDRPDVTDDDSFVSLGGDSLSYVTTSIRLEELLGHLPAGWHTTSVRDLVPASPEARRRRGHVVETSVALRAVAIVLIVSTHAQLFDVKGSAHVLMAVAGFNFARFQLTATSSGARLRRQLTSIARIVVPSVLWIGAAYLLTDRYGPQNVVLLNVVLGPSEWSSRWDFWFVEVLVLVLLALAALLAVPWVDRVERRFPFAFVGGLVAVGLVWRFGLTDVDLLHTMPVFWLFALGWAAAKASAAWHRWAVTAVAALAVPGFFDDPLRDGMILAGIVALVWLPSVRCPRWLSRVGGVLASAALYVYLTHWQVYPYLDDVSPLLAVVCSLAVGIGYWQLSSRASGWLRALREGRRTGRRETVPELTAPGRPSAPRAPHA